MSDNNKLLAIAHTWHDSEGENTHIRIISARESTPREKQQYNQQPR